MRDFNYKKRYEALLTPEITTMLCRIHELRGVQKDFIYNKKDVLTPLTETARVQSTEASNKLEGISASDARLRQIVLNKAQPENRNEQEIAGYNNVLSSIHNSYAFITPTPSVILQFHRDMYQFCGPDEGGFYKTADNIIEAEDENGNKHVRFRPVPAWQTSEAVNKLCTAFSEAVKDHFTDPLLLIPMFILDFLCIHPFNDGNGRISRLLTLLLLFRADHMTGAFISIEKMILADADAYYDTLQKSSEGWHEGTNDYMPFVKYMLSIITEAYCEFEKRVKAVNDERLSKPERIRQEIKYTLGQITKTEIMERCPGISQITVQRTLSDLIKSGEIIKIGGGRYTTYIWNSEV